MKTTASLQRILSWVPLGWVALFAFFVLRAYLKLGRMPSYNNPDPKDLGFGMHHAVSFYGLFAVYAALLPWLALTVFLIIKNRKILRTADICAFVIGFVCIVLMGYTDPFGLDTWFID